MLLQSIAQFIYFQSGQFLTLSDSPYLYVCMRLCKPLSSIGPSASMYVQSAMPLYSSTMYKLSIDCHFHHSNHAGLVPRQVTTAATEEGTFALTQSVEGQWTRSPHMTGPHICSTPWRMFCLQSTAARGHLQTVIATNRSGP